MLTQEVLKQYLSYDPETGLFKYKMSSQRRIAGEVAIGSITNKGYRRIHVAGKLYLDGRLAFLYMTGEFPTISMQIDHINGVKLDCRWANLRIATASQNQYNTKIMHDNTSGIKGINWVKRMQVWRVRIRHNNVVIELGRYESLEDAKQILAAKRLELHKEFANHG